MAIPGSMVISNPWPSSSHAGNFPFAIQEEEIWGGGGQVEVGTWVSPEAFSSSWGDRLPKQIWLGGRRPRMQEYTLFLTWVDSGKTWSGWSWGSAVVLGGDWEGWGKGGTTFFLKLRK